MKWVRYLLAGSFLAFNVHADELSEPNKTLPAGEVIHSQLAENMPEAKINALVKAQKLIKEFKRSPADKNLAQDAIVHLKQFLELSKPEEGLLRKKAMNNLAVLLMRLKKYDEAYKWLSKSLNEETWVALTLANLNQLYAYQAQQAYKEVFEKSVVQTPQGQFMDLPTEFNELYKRVESNEAKAN